jgi:hypothetical protein
MEIHLKVAAIDTGFSRLDVAAGKLCGIREKRGGQVLTATPQSYLVLAHNSQRNLSL